MSIKSMAKLLLMTAASVVVLFFLVRQFAPAGVQAYFRV
jgi:hypothetical protein